MYKLSAVVHSVGSRRMGPTITVNAGTCSAQGGSVLASTARTWMDRIVRPITEEEENYELFRVQKNSGPNLKMKGKVQLQMNRKSESKKWNSYDSI